MKYLPFLLKNMTHKSESSERKTKSSLNLPIQPTVYILNFN